LPVRKIMIFGGQSHATYLGCLTCSEYDSESVFNAYGSYGSKYSTTSIFNKYGSFGSRYSGESACSPYATDRPVFVDSNGGDYWRVTVRNYGDGPPTAELRAWISGVCAG